MSLLNTTQISGNGANLPVSRAKTTGSKRRKLVKKSQALENIENLSPILEESVKPSFISKESTFKEQLAGSVFQKQLSEHLSRKVSQLFDGIRDEIDKAERRRAITAPMYDAKSLSFEQTILDVSFSYLSRINHAITAIANQGDFSYALNEASRVFEAIDNGFSSTVVEIKELGIFNSDMASSFSMAKSTMENGLLKNATKVLEADTAFIKPDAGIRAKPSKPTFDSLKLSDSEFKARLLSRYNTNSYQESPFSYDEKIHAGIEAENITIVTMQAVTGESVDIYLANEVNVPLAEKWFYQSEKIVESILIQRNRYVKLLAGFSSHLEGSEIDAVRHLLHRFVQLGDGYFINRIGQSYLAAESYGYSNGELAAYLMDGHRKLYRKNIDVYHHISRDLVKTNNSENVDELDLLEGFVQELNDLMFVSKEFGIKEGDEFVASVLQTIISYDGRGDYNFYRSDIDSAEVIDCLIKGLREVGL
ncbi:MAG: hypothetical protein JKY01_13210 [Pseudomonadales bacterium]|nr:hypothetical protein [Pseudomonadales bacterium]